MCARAHLSCEKLSRKSVATLGWRANNVRPYSLYDVLMTRKRRLAGYPRNAARVWWSTSSPAIQPQQPQADGNAERDSTIKKQQAPIAGACCFCSANRKGSPGGELSPKVTEGWLDGGFAPWGHPSPAYAGAPLQGSLLGFMFFYNSYAGAASLTPRETYGYYNLISRWGTAK